MVVGNKQDNVRYDFKLTLKMPSIFVCLHLGRFNLSTKNLFIDMADIITLAEKKLCWISRRQSPDVSSIREAMFVRR
jgi:hypothetical protein